MHIYIITDLEGISAVDSIDMMDENSEGYKLACERLMSDTNAAIEGAFAGGADKVYVVDGHGSGHAVLRPYGDRDLAGFQDRHIAVLVDFGDGFIAARPGEFFKLCTCWLSCYINSF